MIPGNAERAFVVLVLLLSAGAFMSLTVTPGQIQNEAAGMSAMQLLWSLIYVITVYLFFSRCEQPLRLLLSGWPLFALCALAMTSIHWSQAPELTFRRSVALVLTVLFGIYFGSRFSLKEQFHLLAWTCGISVVGSFVFGVFGLGAAVDQGNNLPGWYGIFVQKNDLGRVMLLSALVFFFWRKVQPEKKGLASAGLLASLTLIGLSRSMTAIVALVLLLIVLLYLRWAARKGPRWTVAGIALLITVGMISLIYVATHLEETTALLGKSASLTGRVQIWVLSTVMALRRPWLGYGYNAFWLEDQRATVRIWHAMNWTVPNAHNGLLEIWLELGLAGVGLFLLVFAYYALRSVSFLRAFQETDVAAWPIMFLVFDFVTNLTEAGFLSRNTIFLILFVAAAMMTKRKRGDVRTPGLLGVATQSPA